MSDSIYSRLKVAGTKQYRDEMPNPDYDQEDENSLAMTPNTKQTRDEYLAGVIDEAIKGILKGHEVHQASQDVVKSKQEEIDNLNISTTIL